MLVQTRKYSDSIQNLTFRPPTMDDLTAIVDLRNTCAVDLTGLPDTSRNEVLSDWTEPAFDLSTSVRIVETAEEKIVAYIEVWDTDPIPVSNWVWGRVHPEFEGLGIGTELMKWAEERLQYTLARVPKDLRVVYAAGGLKTHVPTRKLLEDLGMELNRYFWRMVIDLAEATPAPIWPRNIKMKSLAEGIELRDIYRAFDESFQDHWGYVQQPEQEMLAEWKHWISSDEEFNPALWFAAMDGDEIAGICLCRRREWEDSDMGWVNIFGVRRRWRKQGLGLAMLHFAFDEFRRMGKLRAGLGVDAKSLTGATRLYDRAGMHVAREFYTYEKELRAGRDISKQTL